MSKKEIKVINDSRFELINNNCCYSVMQTHNLKLIIDNELSNNCFSRLMS